MAGKFAEPVWPNAGVEAWYRRQLELLIFDMSAAMFQAIRKGWREGTPVVDGVAQDASSRTVTLKRAMDLWADRWVKKLDAMSEELARKFASRNFKATETAMKATFSKVGFVVNFKPSARQKAAYRAVVAENVNLIKSIAPQYLGRVQSRVWSSVMAGRDLDTLIKSLQKEYGVTYRRAELIARDQNNKAKAVIERVDRQEVGVKQAKWMHSHAGKEPRPTHVKMNGQLFNINEGIYDSDEGKKVFPGELINCRCASKPKIPGLEDED